MRLRVLLTSLRSPKRWLLSVLLLFSHHLRAETLLEFSEPCMGTLFRIQVYASDREIISPVIEQAWEQAHELDLIFSDYIPESELNIFCRNSNGSELPTSLPFRTVLETGVMLHAETKGLFDISLGSLQRLWRLSRRDGRLPDQDTLKQARQRIGMERLKIGTLGVSLDAGTRLDLGGIAKGYTADVLLKFLKSKGYPCAIVAASGDLAIGDAPPGKDGWTIGIGSVLSPEKPDLTLSLKNCGISTSGDTRQFIVVDEQNYSHLLDPSTGLGLTRRQSATVVARNCLTSDALATALCLFEASDTLPSWPSILSARVISLGQKNTQAREYRVGPHFKNIEPH